MIVKHEFEITANHFVKVPVTDNMVHEARTLANELGELKNSIRKGTGNLAGYLGQLAVERAIVGVKRNEMYDFDIIIDKKNIEVKTKDRTVPPRPNYECSVAATNASQFGDRYLFVSTYREGDQFKFAYLLGWIDCSAYYKLAKPLKRGDIDPSNNFTVKADCYNLPIHKLKQEWNK